MSGGEKVSTFSTIPLGESVADERLRAFLETADAVGNLAAIAIAAVKAEKDEDLQSEREESSELSPQRQDVDDRRDE